MRVRPLILSALGLLALLLAGLAWAWSSGWLAAALLVQDVAAGPGGGLSRQLSPPVQRGMVEWTGQGRIWPVDRYQAGAPRLSGVVLVPGASPAGKDDPRLVAFAEALARAGFDVFVPQIDELATLRIGPEMVRPVLGAARLAANLTGAPVGVVAISFASGPAVLAALQERSIAWLGAVGGYYDALAAVTYITTGGVRTPQGWERREPNHYGKWVFVAGNLARLSDPWDQAMLASIVERRLTQPQAPVDEFVQNLRGEGRAVWALLENQDPERVPELVAALPEPLRRDIEGLDLSRRDLSRLTAHLILVHGARDAIIPPEQSMALAQAVPSAELYLPASIDHAAITPGGWGDALELLRAAHAVLRAGTGAPISKGR